jgi:hypothetical protein
MGVKIADFDYVGFSGSRHGAPHKLIHSAISKAHEGATICVGCATGVDEQVRLEVGDNASLRVFRAAEYPGATYPQKLANRSAALVKFLHENDGCLFALPMKACPNGLFPCTQWKSAKGSGTWGTIALAVGLGLPTMLWLPNGIQPPTDWNGRLDRMSNNWWLSLAF